MSGTTPPESGVAGSETDFVPIHVVARRFGISKIILRALERRYGLLQSTRSEMGHRLYCSAQIRRIELITRALGEGVPLSAMQVWLQDNDCAHAADDTPAFIAANAAGSTGVVQEKKAVPAATTPMDATP